MYSNSGSSTQQQFFNANSNIYQGGLSDTDEKALAHLVFGLKRRDKIIFEVLIPLVVKLVLMLVSVAKKNGRA